MELFSPRNRKSAATPARLEGTLQRVVYASDESGWAVVRLQVAGQPQPVTAVGNLMGVQPGENLRLTGEWVVDRKYGRQFRVDSYLTVQPSTLEGVEKYLGSGLVHGIGPVMARRLVGRFGLETLDVIDTCPERLAEVEGIGPVRIEGIQKAWAEQRGIRDILIFLQSHGVTTAYATRIYRRYGSQAMTVVRQNPYRLATDVHGIGFVIADQLAARLGIERESEARMEAGVQYALARLEDAGHVFAPRELLVSEAASVLEVDVALVEAAVVRLAKGGGVIIEAVSGQEAVYGRPLHDAEVDLARRLGELLATPAAAPRRLPQQAIAAAVACLAPQQQEAVRQALTRNVLVITGGPGTGKTTLVKALLQLLEEAGLSTALCAPTGRAAKRLAETTGRAARTVHRLLEFNPRQRCFERHADHPLELDVLIVDEVSMVDLSLADAILRALPASSRLVLVGDVDQLPSVGPGNVLAELIGSGVVPVVRLTHIFRQSEGSRIVVNAHRVNRGEMPALAGAREDSDFFFIQRDEPEEVVATIADLVTRRIPRRFRLDPLDDIQVLSPMNRGLLGVINLNAVLQARVHPGREPTAGRRGPLAAGDKVMQVRNNYDLDVFNGDIGRVMGLDEGHLVVRFDGRQVRYSPADAEDLVLAYAVSIHKSQGNEYPCVVVPVHTQHFVMLKRNLLYTAITRGRRLVVMVGSHRAMALAVRNNRVGSRHTALAARLRQEI